jgi:hypothetical protein
METVIVTNCTARKRLVQQEKVALPSTGSRSLNEHAQAWLGTLQTTQASVPVRELYVGRSVTESSTVARLLDARLRFVSAGLGLVDGVERWPHYNLTISKGNGSIAPMLARFNATSMDWWLALNSVRNQPTPLKALLLSPVDLVLVAMPSGYIEMVSEDLAYVPADSLRKLRIFTSNGGDRTLGPHVKKCVMPYDDRLEAVFPGTKADYPQRAMRHFVESLAAHKLSRSDGYEKVHRAMSALEAPRLPPRTKATDAQIMSMLTDQWSRHGGQSSRLLRYLRDDALVACEQGRFRELWLQVKAQHEREAAHG